MNANDLMKAIDFDKLVTKVMDRMDEKAREKPKPKPKKSAEATRAKAIANLTRAPF